MTVTLQYYSITSCGKQVNSESADIKSLSSWPGAVQRDVGLKTHKGNEIDWALKIRRIWGLPWWSSGWDTTLPLQGAWVRSPVGELGFHRSQDPAPGPPIKRKMRKIEQQNTRELHGMKNNCMHGQLGQILDKRYKETRKPNWNF